MTIYFILLIILIVLTTCLIKGDGLKQGISKTIGGLLNKSTEEKYQVDEILTKAKFKLAIPDILNNRSSSFDHVTYDILTTKKKELAKLTSKGTLLEQVKQRNYDDIRLQEALECDGCIFDKEMELLNCLVLRDENPVLYMPFYNADILIEEIADRADEIFTEESNNLGDFQAKMNTIDRLKVEFNDIDQSLLNDTIRELISV